MARTKRMRSKRIAPGYYEVETTKGTYEIHWVPANRGYGARWHVTWPGERMPDAAFRTKREALDSIENEVYATGRLADELRRRDGRH